MKIKGIKFLLIKNIKRGFYMAKATGKIVVNTEFCKGCELCVAACPTKVIELGKKLNMKGYLYAVQEKEGCVGCATCAVICPEGAITVYKES
jgi:2-oxoglutarate ferredoxin oxidoreductase subunit delta